MKVYLQPNGMIAITFHRLSPEEKKILLQGIADGTRRLSRQNKVKVSIISSKYDFYSGLGQQK
ncbi:MAG: hypothetical protein ACK5LX_13925 [Oscillospiraceae bacterium]